MIRLIKYFSLLIPVFLFNGCGTRIDCPAFDNNLLEWLPYESNDNISMVNIAGDSIIIFEIKDFYVEHTTHYMTNLDCGTCNDRILVNYGDGVVDDLEVRYYLTENTITAQEFLIMNSYFSIYQSNYSEQEDYEFQGEVFNFVRIFENPDTDELFSKLVIARGYGIIGLTDREGNTWKLLPDTRKSGSADGIEIRNQSCE